MEQLIRSLVRRVLGLVRAAVRRARRDFFRVCLNWREWLTGLVTAVAGLMALYAARCFMIARFPKPWVLLLATGRGDLIRLVDSHRVVCVSVAGASMWLATVVTEEIVGL